MKIKVNTNCGRNAGKTSYIAYDQRFNDKKTFTGSDPRINARKRTIRARRVLQVPQFSAWEWVQLLGILFLIFLIYCWYVYK